jgi:hypothetical protein
VTRQGGRVVGAVQQPVAELTPAVVTPLHRGDTVSG